MASRNTAVQILPLLWLSRGTAGRSIPIREDMLQDLAPFLPDAAQSRMLKTASILQAARQMQQAERLTPMTVPRRSDPVELLSALSRYAGGGSGLLRVTQQLQRMRQLRGMLGTLSSLPQGLGGFLGREQEETREVPAAPQAETVPMPSRDLIAGFQSALSHMDPETLQQMRQIARNFAP